MDELKIGFKFMKNLLSKLAKMAIRKKTGCNINIQVNGVHANMSDEKAHIHLDIDAELSKYELTKILKSIGLD